MNSGVYFPLAFTSGCCCWLTCSMYSLLVSAPWAAAVNTESLAK